MMSVRKLRKLPCQKLRCQFTKSTEYGALLVSHDYLRIVMPILGTVYLSPRFREDVPTPIPHTSIRPRG